MKLIKLFKLALCKLVFKHLQTANFVELRYIKIKQVSICCNQRASTNQFLLTHFNRSALCPHKEGREFNSTRYIFAFGNYTNYVLATNYTVCMYTFLHE